MMIQEFQSMTGLYPSAEMWEAIESGYMNSGMMKDDFCKAYLANEDCLAATIATEANRAAMKELDNQRMLLGKADTMIEGLQQTVRRLRESLEREQEWKPYSTWKNITEEKYSDLATSSIADALTDEQCKKIIDRAFGFSPAKVEIVRSAPRYEINRHHMIRQVDGPGVDCAPFYGSSDWYYIRFTCCGYVYEAVDDELYRLD